MQSWKLLPGMDTVARGESKHVHLANTKSRDISDWDGFTSQLLYFSPVNASFLSQVASTSLSFFLKEKKFAVEFSS